MPSAEARDIEPQETYTQADQPHIKRATALSSAFNVNHNVLYTFIYKFSDGIAQGVWSLASMATYIYLLENNSTKVHSLA